MPNAPIPTRLFLNAALAYVIKKSGDDTLVRIFFYNALRTGTLVAEGSIATLQPWQRNPNISLRYDPRESNFQPIPSEAWQPYNDIQFNARIASLDKINIRGENDRTYYLNPTLATADLDAWLNSFDAQSDLGKTQKHIDTKSHKRKPGPEPVKMEAVKKTMLERLHKGQLSVESLSKQKQESLAEEYKCSRETVTKARILAIKKYQS